MFIVGDVDYAVSTVAGYLDRQIYYPRSRSMGSFTLWNRNRNQRLPLQSVVGTATDMANSRKEKVLIISNGPLEIESSSVHEVAEFTGSIETSEDFYLYLVDPTN